MSDSDEIAKKVENHKLFLANLKERISALASVLATMGLTYDDEHGSSLTQPAMDALASVISDAVISGASALTIALLREGRISLADCIEGSTKEIAERWKKGTTVH
jgi:hypothetical protein